MPPIYRKKRLHSTHALLLACAAVLLLSVAVFATGVLHRRSVAVTLTPERARELVAARLHDPLVLPLPDFTTVRRGSPDDIAYRGLVSTGVITREIIGTRFYRHQRAPYDRLRLQLTEAGWTASADWPRRGDDSFLVPLARPQILDMGLSPGADPASGSADYWIRWKWQPTDLGAQLIPSLYGVWHVPTRTFGAHATLTRGEAGWQVSSLTIER